MDEPEGDPYSGEQELNSPKTYLHVSPYPGQHVRSYADSWALDAFLGRVTRTHEDSDALILQRDHVQIRQTLADWET